MGNLKVAGLDIGSHNLTIDELSGTLLVDGEEVSGSGGGGISYVWANEAAKLATTGMKTDEQGLQQDTGIVYKYTGSAWVTYYSFKADINTVYAEPMSTNYTTRNETLEANKTVRYPLNGVNNNYALHAFALKELPAGKDVLSLNTVLMGSGYYGVKIPKIDNIQLSFLSGTQEPLKRMSAHNQYGQTISATNEINANYVVWKLFSAGDVPTSEFDCWHSAATLTPSTPLIVTFTSPNVFSMSSYKMVNRGGATASPRTWRIEGRVGSFGDWELIHEVVDDTGNTPSLARVFNIPEENRKACDQHRLVILNSNGVPYVTLARLIIYQETSKFMLEDGVNKYRPTSDGELELVPNVTTKNDITVNGTSSGVIISKEKLSTLSNPYIITDKPASVELTMDSEKEYEYSNNVKIALANTYIKFTATESGKYKFCYQEPAPDTP